MKILPFFKRQDEKGATAVIVAILLLFVLIPIGALAIDLAVLYVVRNELQNAADAGALAGARQLYLEGAAEINTGTNQAAFDAVVSNFTYGNIQVETSLADIERGHWSFGLGNNVKGFTPNPSTAIVDLFLVNEDGDRELKPFEALDGDSNFINALRVKVKREATPVVAYLSSIFGQQGFTLSATAIGYIGFAGGPGSFVEFDQPLAICDDSLTGPNSINCNIGRMIADNNPGETGMWTNLIETSCTASTSEIRPLMDPCEPEERERVEIGTVIGTTGGVVDAVFEHPQHASLMGCWKEVNQADLSPENDIPVVPWNLRLPLIDCSGSPGCKVVTGALDVTVLYITKVANDVDGDAPWAMDGWEGNNHADWVYPASCNEFSSLAGGTIQEAVNSLTANTDLIFHDNMSADRWGQGHHEYTIGKARWDCFANHFDLQDASGGPAKFLKKTVYFGPLCEKSETSGGRIGPGGENTGMLTRIPVLVR